ncbi:acetyl-CoA synthetase-like protein, partial [Glonium stellatum]
MGSWPNPSAQLAQEYGADLEDPLPTSLELFSESARGHADNLAVISMHQTEDILNSLHSSKQGHIQWTYADLKNGADILSQRLVELGFQKESPIIAVLPNQAEWALFSWTATVLKTTFVPLNPAFITNAAEAEHVLGTVGPGVLIVNDQKGAADIQRVIPARVAECPLRIICSTESNSNLSGWTSLKSLFSKEESAHKPSFEHISLRNSLQHPFILFTSGTTSLPKACPISEVNHCSGSLGCKEVCGFESNHRLAQLLPSNHAFAINLSFGFWFSGGTVVYPSPSFSPMSALEAVELAHCTHMAAVPSILQAITAHPSLPKRNLESLDTIITGGAIAPPELVQAAHDPKILGVKNVVICFGMTEAHSILFWDSKRDGSPLLGNKVRTGRPARGVRVRICKPGSREPVMRGEAGELHHGGPQVAAGYHDADSSMFYKDPSGEFWWMASGDQAVMDEDGILQILGRYKDLIIRGGENISPATIETVLNNVNGINSQVVGVPDEVAGEVPIAVIKTADGNHVTKQELLKLVLHKLGSRYSLKAILHLRDDLNLQNYPSTASGKPKKGEIARLVREYLDAAPLIPEGSSGTSTTTQLINIWAGLSGHSADFLDSALSADDFADSLMIMQFIYSVRKILGKQITAEDLKTHRTISEQAKLIDSCSKLSDTVTRRSRREGPPGVKDMVHTGGDNRVADETRRAVQGVIEPMGLSWDVDVEDVWPVYDFGQVMLRRLRPQSWNHRHAYATSQANCEELRAALEACLENHPMLRTVGVQLDESVRRDPTTASIPNEADTNPSHGTDLLTSGTTVHVIIRPTKRWFNQSITEGLEVEKPEDLATLALNDPVLDFGAYPGPLVRFIIAKIRSTGTAGLVFQGNHSAFDALSTFWIDDLSQVLAHGPASLEEHVNYKDFADAYYLNRDGPSSRESSAFHAARLEGLHKITALWPPQRAPEWFKGDDTNFHHSDGRAGKPNERIPLDGAAKLGVDGITRLARFPALPTLKATHNIPASTLLKAACALFNAAQTRSSSALFAHYDAARTWPFATDPAALPPPL